MNLRYVGIVTVLTSLIQYLIVQVVILDQNDVQFLGHCILSKATLTAFRYDISNTMAKTELITPKNVGA